VTSFEQGWSPDCLTWPASEDGWGVVKAGCVNRGIFDERENKALPELLEPNANLEIQPGDVLMSRASGSPELIGSTAYIAQVRGRLMLSDKIFRLHLAVGVDGRFLAIAFGARFFRMQIERAISGAEGLANNLPQSSVKSFLIALPPIDEQQQIVSHCNARGTEFNGLIAAVEHASSLLQERRTALISAAVTGKIDVRGLTDAA
jgi:type I restriction enzyme, S subunit